jgi:hypothetical protein
MNKSTLADYQAFARSILQFRQAIHDSLARNPIQSGPTAPKGWPETQEMLRNAANDLMLCLDVHTAVEKLRDYPPAMILLEIILKATEGEYLKQTLRSAFAERPGKSDALPGEPIATLLLEIAKGDGPPPISLVDVLPFL